MNTYKIKFACVALFALVAANAHAQSADSSSSANTNSSSVGIGQGGGSSLNNISNTSTSSVTGSSTSTSIGGLATANGGSVRNSGNSSSNSGVKGSGNSNVTVSVALAGGTGSSGTSGNGTPVSNAQVGDPGSSPYNTNSRVEYSGTQTVKTNPAIQAPGLTTTLSDTCMGSVSFGFSAPGFGATAGSTLVDQACVRRLDAREFRAMGLTDVALALLCQSDSNRRAVESTGHLCPGTTAPLAKVTTNEGNTGTVADDEKYHDPIVRQRMGLPPLAEVAKYQPAIVKPAMPVQQIPAPAAPAAPQPKANDNAVVATPVVSGNTTSVAALH